MRADFQEEILKFVLQTKEGKKFRQFLDKSLWDEPTNQVVFDLYASYVDKYGGQPSKVTLMELFDRELKKAKGEKISKEVYTAIEKQVYYMFEPFQEDAGLIRDSIVEFAKRKRAKLMFKNNADKVKDGDDEFFSQLLKEMNGIVQLSTKVEDKEKHRSGSLVHQVDIENDETQDGHPTFLKRLNAMTASGGFYSPQLVVFMGQPKSFKTGTVMNLGKEYARDGLKVYYVDCENGVKPTKARFYQSVMECTRHDLREFRKNGKLKDMMQRFGGMGGDFRVGYFPANVSTLDDVDAELEFLRDEENWQPDVIMYDYLGLFKSSNSRITEKRIILQDVYHHAIRLNVKWGTFAMNIATVGRNAVNKAVITMKDFGEDFAQAYNCHAAFAICRTEEEMETGLARIIPVAQRDGSPYTGSNTCMLSLDPSIMMVEEITMGSVSSKLNSKDIKDE